MTSRHLVDPEILAIADSVRFPFAAGLERVRAQRAAMAPPRAPAPEDLAVREVFVSGWRGDPDVRVLVTEPQTTGSPRPAILHIHGGGFVMGEADMTADDDARYARKLGAVVVSVDYRLAPETPYPGPLHDCYAALAWMFDHAADLRIDPARIAVAGQSAGGGLGAATVLMAQERGDYAVAFQHLVYPMIDDRSGWKDARSPMQGEFVWSSEDNRFAWHAMLGSDAGTDNVCSLAAPARARDLSGLPPTFIACGALDLFLEESIDYARRLALAGVPTELHIYPGATHGFVYARKAKVTRAFANNALAAMATGLGVES